MVELNARRLGTLALYFSYNDNFDNNVTFPEYEHTYLNMEVALPKDNNGPEFARVTKGLRDANGIPIGTAHDNPLLHSRIY